VIPDGEENESSRTLSQERLVLSLIVGSLDYLFATLVHVDLGQLGSNLLGRRDRKSRGRHCGGDGSGEETAATCRRGKRACRVSEG
jgi:hypothetical protein